MVPESRCRALGDAPVRPRGRFVLYWMTAFRRTRSNFALQRAVELANELGRPLLVFEALRAGYPWASPRFHRFVVQGMADNARACRRAGVRYYAYVEPRGGDGSGLLERLARDACAVVTDDFPGFFHPRMLQAAAQRLPVRLEAVDSNGLLPLSVSGRPFKTAFSFRAFLQKELPPHLDDLPATRPLGALAKGPAQVPRKVLDRWTETGAVSLEKPDALVADVSLEHATPAAGVDGGPRSARKLLRRFVSRSLDSYAEQRNRLEDGATSMLSPYLHFGHVSAHEVFREVARAEGWSPASLEGPAGGRREGWWNMRPTAEAFLDQLVTWRELGFQQCRYDPGYDRYASLPDWARATLERHAGDERERLYDLGAFDAAKTHDPLWNAAQRQLVRDGTIHNYLRMLWGKKILEWSRSPRQALKIMIELNNRYALDGRDPNSYSGIFWCLGRYDRPWGPERPVFGTVRFMSSRSTARKIDVRGYLERYAAPGEPS